ncbi:MAG TPA: hypothetical protein VMX54_21490 [Vicinamibacteria bacterium]|nr:hypothetical protein [Vicinamibacteria bacterium]
MTLQPTATRLWKHLPPDERRRAANAFFANTPAELAAIALGALAKARHMRPQAARKLPPEAQARILASTLDPGEPLAQGLLVALHLSERRPLLGAFLDALGLPHEEGLLEEDAESAPPVTEEAARQAVAALSGFPREHVLTYLNTLLLQDAERWAALEHAVEWVEAGTPG